MPKIFHVLPQKIIESSFYLLLFLVPIILTPFNYELFEYNKMMLTYGLTVIIVGAWIIKIIIHKKIFFKRTPLDIPLIFFLVSQIISTILSIDRHVSIWGYYSRFNGGLLSTISYILLYFAFVSNFPSEKIRKLLKITLVSGLLVSIYGVLEHFGIDKNLWVQDVQNRVFSTLGQPNWLAAYLAVLIPISIGLLINWKFEYRNSKQAQNPKNSSRQARTVKYYSSSDPPAGGESRSFNNLNLFRISVLVFLILTAAFYATLIFTKSRSGFLGFWISFSILWFFVFIQTFQNSARAEFWKSGFRIINFNLVLICIITLLLGAPFEQINRFTLPQLLSNPQPTTQNPQSITNTGSSIIDVGVTESGTIRKIVWQGAVNIFRHYPLFGTGVETFAFSYYKYRPVEHNMTSEWDFLYNKAHNEYLNYAATTGAFGLGSYLLIILVFIVWNLQKLKVQSSNVIFSTSSKNNIIRASERVENLNLWILSFGLFAGWLSILITNFFGFSVVIIQLFFFLIPAICFVLNNLSLRAEGEAIPDLVRDRHVPINIGTRDDNGETTNPYQLLTILIVFSVICYMLYILCRLWYADTVFADGYRKVRSQEIVPAYQTLKSALELNQDEPLYFDEFSYPAAQIAVAFFDEKQATLSAVLEKEAIIASDYAVSQAPQNVNYWKTRTRVFYTLSAISDKYFNDSIVALENAKLLSPTDPKVTYNLGLMYDKIGKKKEALNELIETTKLKPDYRDAFFALGYLYEKDKKIDKAKESLQYILTKIATDDAEARKKLDEL